ncbi:unnamed protein product, partial [Amoebophrya sp. A25]|eukprot:GSA25T00001432001.1
MFKNMCMSSPSCSSTAGSDSSWSTTMKMLSTRMNRRFPRRHLELLCVVINMMIFTGVALARLEEDD